MDEVMDARAATRRKVMTYCPDELKGNVVCHLDQHSLNIDLRNLAIMSRSDHMRLQTLLRYYKIPKGKASKKFAVYLRSIEKIEMIHPIKKKKKVSVQGFTFD